MLPDCWFEDALGYAKCLAKLTGKHVFHPMQTNAILLTHDRLQRLTELGVSVGISYDGPPDVSDEIRGGAKIVEQRLEDAARSGLLGGMILVLSSANFGHIPRIMERLAKFGVKRFRIIFLLPQGWGRHLSLNADQMFKGMVAAFEHMVTTRCSVIEAESKECYSVTSSVARAQHHYPVGSSSAKLDAPMFLSTTAGISSRAVPTSSITNLGLLPNRCPETTFIKHLNLST